MALQFANSAVRVNSVAAGNILIPHSHHRFSELLERYPEEIQALRNPDGSISDHFMIPEGALSALVASHCQRSHCHGPLTATPIPCLHCPHSHLACEPTLLIHTRPLLLPPLPFVAAVVPYMPPCCLFFY